MQNSYSLLKPTVSTTSPIKSQSNIRRQSSYLPFAINKSSNEKVDQGTPTSNISQRRSFLPQEQTFEYKSHESKQQTQPDQQQYQSLVDALNTNNEKQITTQRNEIFTLKMTVDEQEKKLAFLQTKCNQLEGSYREKVKYTEELEGKLSSAVAKIESLEKQMESKDERICNISEQLGVFKTNEIHQKSQFGEKDQQIMDLEKKIKALKQQIDENSYENNKILQEELNTWKYKFIELNKQFNIVQEKLTIAQAEMDSACKTRDSIISKTNEIRNQNQRRRTMIVQPFRRKDDDDEQSNA